MSAPARLPVAGKRCVSMLTRDGVRLVADLWQPDGPGPYPVLLMRQAYGRRIGTALCYAPPAWYASHGYIVVIQDVRGRGESGGRFDLFRDEAADGADSVAWAACLPNANGLVGMFGFSFQGTNQLLAATAPCPALRAIAPAMIGWDLRTDWAYENGAFPLRANLGWATQLAAETARLAEDHAAHAELYASGHALPLSGPRPGRPDFMDRLGHYTHYAQWADHPEDGAYWQAISPASKRRQIFENGPAVFLIGGWYDSHLPGTLAAWRALRGHVPLRMAIGPWSHFPWDRKVGDLDFGAAAVGDIDRQQIAWFDRWLKTDPAPAPEASLSLFDMGAHVWRTQDDLAAPGTMLFLGGTGRAAIDTGDGVLAATPMPPSDEYLVHDPWRPAAPCGGSFGLPAGPVDRRATDARADVLCFTTAPFEADSLLCGEIRLTLSVASDTRAFDLHAALSRVTAAGASYPLAEGYGSFGNQADPVTLKMRATCATIGAGEFLRLSIAAACFPAFPVNPGNGMRPWDAALSDLSVITLQVRTGAASGSALFLPVAPHAEEPSP